MSDPLSNRVGEDPSACQRVGDNVSRDFHLIFSSFYLNHNRIQCQQGRDCCSGECLISSRKCVKGKNNGEYSFNNKSLNSSTSKGQREEPEPQSVDDGRVCSRENQQVSLTSGFVFSLICYFAVSFQEQESTEISKDYQNHDLYLEI